MSDRRSGLFGWTRPKPPPPPPPAPKPDTFEQQTTKALGSLLVLMQQNNALLLSIQTLLTTPRSVSIHAGTPSPQEDEAMPTTPLQLLDSQKVLLTIAETDALGETDTEPATWTVDNADAVTLVPSDDGLSCEATAGTGTGLATVTATAPGVDATGAATTLTATYEIDVTAGPPSALVITAGTPEPK